MPRRVEPHGVLRWAGPAILFMALITIRGLGDRWWGALPLLFGPRWPLLALVPVPLLTLRRGPRGALLATLTGLVLGGLVIDYRLPWRAALPAIGSAPGRTLTIIEWNAQGGGTDPATNIRALLARHPDVMVISECRSELQAILRTLDEQRTHSVSDVCLVTSHPVIEWSPLDPEAFWRASGSGAIGRMVIDIDGREVVVGGVHLETPREALEELMFLSLRGFIREDSRKREQREIESAAARNWIAPAAERRPVVIAGDFNLVVESAIYQRWWGDLTNVFNARGTGLGWTKVTRFFGVRIDHVLVGNGMTPVSITHGPPMGSDHRPLVATLSLPPD